MSVRTKRKAAWEAAFLGICLGSLAEIGVEDGLEFRRALYFPDEGFGFAEVIFFGLGFGNEFHAVLEGIDGIGNFQGETFEIAVAVFA